MTKVARVRAFLRRHLLFKVVLLLELLFGLALAGGMLKPLAQVSIPLDKVAAESDDGTWTTAPVALSTGGYSITIQYHVASEEDTHTGGQMLGTLQFASAQMPSAVRSDAITLTSTYTTVEARLWIQTATTVQDLTMSVTPAEGVTLVLDSVVLSEQGISRITLLLSWLVLFVVADALLCLLFLGKAPQRPSCGWWVPMLLTAGILLASLPYLTDFLYVGHDLRFHCYRIWAVAQELAARRFPVRIFASGFYGYGATTPLYYCDLFLYLPALLYNAFLPLQTCYQVYVVLVNAATMLIAYYSFTRISGYKVYGAAAAFAYTLSAYRLSNLLLRASVGEYTAMLFLPLVVLGGWSLAQTECPKVRDWLPLGIGMAGLVQSHLLTTELAALFLAVFWLCNLRWMLRPACLKATLKAVLVAVGLSAWFLWPCLDTLQGERIMLSGVHATPIQSTGTYWIQLLGFFGHAGGTSGDRTAGDLPLTLGLAGCVVLALAVWCCLNRAQWQTAPRQNQNWVGLRGTLAFCLLAMWLSSTSFPWDWLAAHLPQSVTDVLLKLQFLWRYLSIATVLVGVIAALALVLLHTVSPHRAKEAAIAIVAATLLYVGVFYCEYAYDRDTMTMISTGTVTDFPYETMGYEYLPAGTDLTLFEQVGISSADPAVTVERQGSGKILCCNASGTEAVVDLPILAYKHYTAVDEQTGESLTLTKNEQNCLQVLLPAGYSGVVDVRYTPPMSWHIAEMLSAVTLFLLLGYGIRRAYQKYKRGGNRHV